MIDYKIIANSVQYYESAGFARVEAPWLVTQPISALTKPEDKYDYIVSYNNKNKVLVASGEQSFLYLYLKGFLPYGKFQTTTPCWRNESFDFLHTKYFIKNELIDTKDVTVESLKEMTQIALKFYQKFLPDAKIVDTEQGYDICYENYELGSYGIRKCEFLKWIYGTAVAEPRLSSIVKMTKM